MIQIDDAGWNSLIGGVVVSAHRATTGEFASGVIAPRFFQDDAFADKEYLAEAARQVEECFERLRVRSQEEVEVCSGYVLAGVRDWLTSERYDWRLVKIEGSLQMLVERAFWEHLGQLGFLVEYDLYQDPSRRGLLWWRQVEWLKGGDVEAVRPDPLRAESCKTGWGSYEIWATHPYKESRRLTRERRERRRGRSGGWRE